MNLRTVKWAQRDKTQSRELLGLFICVRIALCTIVAHNIAQNRPNNFPSYPPDNHHCSDDVYLREEGGSSRIETSIMRTPRDRKNLAGLLRECSFIRLFMVLLKYGNKNEFTGNFFQTQNMVSSLIL